jgi:hypothetical protein
MTVTGSVPDPLHFLGHPDPLLFLSDLDPPFFQHFYPISSPFTYEILSLRKDSQKCHISLLSLSAWFEIFNIELLNIFQRKYR